MQSITQYRERLDEMFRHCEVAFRDPGLERHKVFLAFSDGSARARTLVGVASTPERAYQKAKSKAVKQAGVCGIPRWIYLGLVDGEEAVSMEELCARLANTRRHYFRYGIALDQEYSAAFLEQEVNGSGLIQYSEDGAPALNRRRIAQVLQRRRGQKSQGALPYRLPERVWLFTCRSCFYDGAFHELHGAGLQSGLRKEMWSGARAEDLARCSGEYLLRTVREDGSFVYGYRPCFDKEIPTYNAIRHCLSVMALLEVYALTGARCYEDAIHRSFRYFLDRYLVQLDERTLAVVDWDNGQEIRLGGLGLAIVLLLQYGAAFGTEEGLPLAEKLANGILRMQHEDGRFTHVLQYPDGGVKDEFRIVYYSGEACYGLMKLYAVTKDERYLRAVVRAFDYFIDNGYEKYYDHWLSYAVNELTRYRPEARYYRFGLDNATCNLDYIIERDTTWPTFLELLNAAVAMVERMRRQGLDELLAGYDVAKLYRALEVRAERQRGGILYPEMAMFYQNPAKMLYGVMIRHHAFRVRDDDVAHHLIGYCHYVEHKRKATEVV